MENLKAALINTGKDSRLLDHLAPFASLHKLPLYLTEERNVEHCEKYYPEVEVIYVPYEEFSLFKLVEKHDLLLQSTFWDKELMELLKKVNPRARFGFLPHGNSDKGFLKPMLKPLEHQDLTFLYGKQMVERLKKQNIKTPPHVFTGNYRLEYYLKNKEFLDGMVPRFNKKNRTILYAPSWNDEEGGTSFFKEVKKLVETLPSSFNLVVKTHPLLEEMDVGRFWAAMPEVKQENVLVLSDFPVIFPLLNTVDIYLGDTSSIGYDFLYFQKPMFFFNPFRSHLLLHQAGITIPEAPFPFIQQQLHLFDEKKKEKQKELWQFAFVNTETFSLDELQTLYARNLS